MEKGLAGYRILDNVFVMLNLVLNSFQYQFSISAMTDTGRS